MCIQPQVKLLLNVRASNPGTKQFIMKQLNVLFIDTTIRCEMADYAFEDACIKYIYIHTGQVPEFQFENIDCIVYGFRLYRNKEYMSMLPDHIPRIIWTATPRHFETKDLIVHKFANVDTISTLPEELEYHDPEMLRMIDFTNKIRQVALQSRD